MLSACSLSIDSFASDISKAVSENNDPYTVMQGLPAYLLLLDGLIESDPDDEELLKASARLLNAYASLLDAQLYLIPEQSAEQIKSIKLQQQRLNNKALHRSQHAICIYSEIYCDLTNIRFDEFETRLQQYDPDDIDMIFSLAMSWSSWLQSNTDDWNAMAKLPQIKMLMEIVVKTDEKWENAGAHMYLGVLNSILPATMGGKPDAGKYHFEKAISLTNGRNMMVKVLYAEYYARLMFDQELHQKLITEVLEIPEDTNEFSMMNTLAKQKARVLQKSSDEYF